MYRSKSKESSLDWLKDCEQHLSTSLDKCDGAWDTCPESDIVFLLVEAGEQIKSALEFVRKAKAKLEEL
jgi:hypothetical protein